MAALQSGPRGLSLAEAVRRLSDYGRNEIPIGPEVSLLKTILRQFKSPLVYVLGAAAIVSLGIKDYTDAMFIGVVLAINTAVGAAQEHRAAKSSRAIQKLLRVRAAVERGGHSQDVDAEEVVPGDVVILEPGGRIPADGRLLESRNLEIDESLLTGESSPAAKDAAAILGEDVALADRRNMVHAGTLTTRGRGRALVTATGRATAVGRLAMAAQSAEAGAPPLVVRMERFSRVISVAIVAAAAAIALLGWIVHEHPGHQMFLFAVSLAISAIPEGLPVALTVALAVASRRMAKRGVLVRRLAAVEGLGSCTMIASDKTGTLTLNELTVREVLLPDGSAVAISGEGYEPEGEIFLPETPAAREALRVLGLCAALSTEAQMRRQDGSWSWQGEPTELALVSLAFKLGIEKDVALDRFPEIERIPFESERRYSASFHQDSDGRRTLIYAAGAPEKVLGMCAGGADGRLLSAADSMASRGLRVLALAGGRLNRTLIPGEAPPEPGGLDFFGLVGIIDPPRPEAKEALQACKRAGVAVSMITGDFPATALAVAQNLGLAESESQVVSGAKLAEMPDEELARAVSSARVFARTDPEQKLTLVTAMQKAGHFVAVTGDGVNDAPALRAANIGVAMGLHGTDAAREAASLVITDDNFATIISGIEEGRIAYGNARKVILLLVSTGAAEVALVAIAMLAGLPLPLLPVQLLWLNLVTNGIQDIALAFEPGEDDVLAHPPRKPTEPIFNRLMLERTVVTGSTMALAGLGLFIYLLRAGWTPEQSRNALLLLLVFFENLDALNCRSETRSLWGFPFWSNPTLIWGVLAALCLHLSMLYLPFGQEVLKTAPLAGKDWVLLLALATTVVAAAEFEKWLWRRRASSRPDKLG